MANRSRSSRAPIAGSFHQLLWDWIAVYFGKKACDAVRTECHIGRGDQLADLPDRGAFLPRFYDAVLEWPDLGVTGRRRQRERASDLIEALRARGDVGCFSHRVSARSVFLGKCLGVGRPSFQPHGSSAVGRDLWAAVLRALGWQW
jgi:hypothetical protein